jgi:hypothetical protein
MCTNSVQCGDTRWKKTQTQTLSTLMHTQPTLLSYFCTHTISLCCAIIATYTRYPQH